MYLCTRISKQEYSPIILLSMAQIISVENQTATKQVVETMSSVEHGVILSLQARLLLEKLHNGICSEAALSPMSLRYINYGSCARNNQVVLVLVWKKSN